MTDDSEIPAPALDKFMKRFDSSVPQLHPHLDRMVATLRGMSEYFPPLGVKAIIQSTVEYVNACALEPVAEKMPIHPAALSYVIARRTKHGVAEPYAAYIFPKVDFPDVLKWLQPMPCVYTHVCVRGVVFTMLLQRYYDLYQLDQVLYYILLTCSIDRHILF